MLVHCFIHHVAIDKLLKADYLYTPHFTNLYLIYAAILAIDSLP